ncbi:hypothetical protein [Pseudomonas guariconensis]|uniref:hypothetical protein n=1 Tax=Pseudomonas guariconensis TaxID=1288410 RepID=UPI002B058C04|nr:hypothetical protein [Pseudomonas guariconensis]
MAITLNLEHTFTTRAVFKTEEITKVRQGLEKALADARKAAESEDFEFLSKPQRMKVIGGIKYLDHLTNLTDEEMLLSLFRSGIRDYFRKDVAKELKTDANVTDVSPLRTRVVA